MGLGLTVSRQLARLMGGDVSYRREGDETIFELALPRLESQSDESTSAISQQPRPDRTARFRPAHPRSRQPDQAQRPDQPSLPR